MKNLRARINTPAKKTLAVFLAISALATVIATILLWPDHENPEPQAGLALSQVISGHSVTGEVVSVSSGRCGSPSSGQLFSGNPTPAPEPPEVPGLSYDIPMCNQHIVELTSGDHEGQRTLLENSGLPGEPKLQVGDDIRLGFSNERYIFLDMHRTVPVLAWVAVILLAVLVIGGLRGARALFGLAMTLAFILAFLLPGILQGGPPTWLAIIAGSFILFLVVPIVHGVNWKSGSALAGTVLALMLTGAIAQLAISTTQLRGLGDENNLVLSLNFPELSIVGLMLAGFIIGALGVLNDVTISQASTVRELHEADETASAKELFTSAMRVGRDHIASMVYTLVLTYTGAALPLLLLLMSSGRGFIQVLTSDAMATEVLRSGIGALGLTLAVPMTTFIAASVYASSKRSVSARSASARSASADSELPDWATEYSPRHAANPDPSR